ncbi:MAG: SRPBCC family protein [Solirubrobacterales bacterium]
MIRWPQGHEPERSLLHAVNELQIDAEPERVFAWLRRPDLWPSYYGNSRFVRRRGGPWPEVALGSRFRWVTFGVIVHSEIVEFDPPARLAWSARELGASGHHAWLLESREGGTFVHTEETQRGWAMGLAAPAMRRLMPRYHQRWLEGLARVVAQGPPPPPEAD